MTIDETPEFCCSDEILVARLVEAAMSHARVALHHRDQTEGEWRIRGDELFALCDLLHNVPVCLVDPRTLPRGASSALDAVLASARHPATRERLREQLTSRNRRDVVDRMGAIHTV